MSTDKCLNCGSDLVHTPGRRPKKYCSGNCRQTHWQELHKNDKKIDPKEIQAKIAEVKKSLEGKPVFKGAVSPENDQLEAQIKEIKGEKIPKERDTIMGRKAWKLEQDKRIKELQSKITCH